VPTFWLVVLLSLALLADLLSLALLAHGGGSERATTPHSRRAGGDKSPSQRHKDNE